MFWRVLFQTWVIITITRVTPSTQYTQQACCLNSLPADRQLLENICRLHVEERNYSQHVPHTSASSSVEDRSEGSDTVRGERMADKLAAAESRYSAFTRDSILSDPRLSQVWWFLKIFSTIISLNYFWFQLFDISQQLEALAESLPPSSKPAEVKLNFLFQGFECSLINVKSKFFIRFCLLHNTGVKFCLIKFSNALT